MLFSTDLMLTRRLAVPNKQALILCSFCFVLLNNISRLLRVTYGPPEESEQRQAQVSTLVNNLRNVEGDVETGPCGKHSISFLW